MGFTPWARGSVQRLCARPSSSSEGTRHFWLRPALPRARVSRQRDCGPGGRDFREAFLKQEAQPFPAFVSLARNVAVMTNGDKHLASGGRSVLRRAGVPRENKRGPLADD